MAVLGLVAGASRTLLIQRRRAGWQLALRSPHRIHRRGRRGAALETVLKEEDMACFGL